MLNQSPEALEALLAETEWLRRLSLALASSCGAADDLCQDTLLTALRRPIRSGSWRPWLARVARNLAHRSARAENRRERRERAAAKHVEQPSTARIVEHISVQRQVVESVLRLSEPYQTTVLLRYWEDLPPREIAKRMAVPTETVRTRLKRAQAMLRDKLDAECGDRRAWVPPLLAVPSVARTVRTAGPGLHAQPALIGLIMKQLAIAALLLVPVLVLSAAYLLLPAAPPASPVLQEPPPEAVSVAVGQESEAAVSAQREAVTASVSAAADAGDLFRVYGRCVDATTGVPLSDCRVEVRLGLRDGRNIWRPWQPEDVADEMTTAHDGVFAIELRGDHRLGCTVRVSAPSRVGRAGYWSRPSETLDLGDLSMTAGHSVRGRVVDEDGAGVARAFVLLTPADGFDARPMARSGVHRAPTDDYGYFRFPRVMPAGECFLTLQGDGSLIEPRMVEIGGTQAEFEFTVRVRRPDPAQSIRGTVTDEDGVPLEEIFVVAVGEGAIGRTESMLDGSFAVPRADPWNDDGTSGVRLTVSDSSGEWDWHLPARDARFEWGQAGLRVVMRRLASRVIVVTDAHNEPVEDCEIHAYRAVVGTRTGMIPYPQVDGRGPHEGGRMPIDGLKRGDESSVLVVPANERLASRIVRFRAERAGGEVRVVLPDRVALTVHVSDGLGAPVVGSRVEVVRPIVPGKLGVDSTTVGVRNLDPRVAAPAFGLLDEGVTGDDGACFLAAPPERLWLRVTGAHHVAHCESVEVLGHSMVHRVVVRAGATLEGELVPPDAVAALQQVPGAGSGEAEHAALEVVLRRTGARSLAPFRVGDGRFRATGLEPGEYGVALRYSLKSHPVHVLPVTVPLTDVVLQPGQGKHLELDVSAAVPTTVQGRMTVDGEPLRGRDVFLRRLDSKFRGSVRVATDSEGRLSAPVPPGDYSVALVLAVEGGSGWIVMPVPGRATVARGLANDIVRDVMRRRARLRLMTVDGDPVATRRVKIAQSGYFRPGSLTTDQDGWFEFSPVPYGPFFVEWVGDDAAKRRVPVTILGADLITEMSLRATR